jgi:pentatricopeptide repeat protein
MQKRCVTPSSITIGCMVEAVAANGDVEGSLKLVSDLLEDPKTKDQINSVIYGSILKHYAKAQKVNRVFEVCSDMLNRGIKPSVITFNTLLDACARSGQMHRVPDLLADMEKRRLSPNMITFSTVIRGYCNKGDVGNAMKSLEQARRHQVRFDAIVYNTLLEVFAKKGMSKEGLQLFEEMKKEGVSPNSFTMTMVARILAPSADSKHTLSFVNEHMKRYRVKGDGLLSAALVDACLHSKDAVGAAKLLQDMVRQGFQTPARKCELTLRQLLNLSQGQCAVDLLRMLLLGPGPRRSCHVQLDDKLMVDVLSGIFSLGGKNVDAAQTLHADRSAVGVLGPQGRAWQADSARSPKGGPWRRA